MGKAEKRGTRFYGFFTDPWRKLISIGLGILLWYYLNASITRTHGATVALQFKQTIRSNHVDIRFGSTQYAHKRFLDSSTREVRTSVRIEVKGSNRLINELQKPGRLKFEVQFTENDVTSGDPPFVEFRLEDLHHKTNPKYDTLLANMTPRVVRVELERNDSMNLLLTRSNVDLTLPPGVDEGRIQKVEFQPKQQLEIFGPLEQIQKISSETKLFTGSISAQDIKTKTKISFQLELAEEFQKKGIQLTVPHVIYTVEPVRPQFLLKGIPVVLDTKRVSAEDGADYEVKQRTVDIRIGASGRLHTELSIFIRTGIKDLHEVHAEWCREHARLRVYLRPENIGNVEIETRKPTLSLFDIDRNDKETPYLSGPDYIVEAQYLPLIDIRRKRKD